MPLRMIEARLPGTDPDEVDEWLENSTIVDRWCAPAHGDTTELRVLADASEIEAIVDRLTDACEGREGFRVVLYQVEATIPVPKEPDDDDAGPDPSPESEADGPPTPARISREELYEDVQDSTRLTTAYVAMVALSTVVASVGLVRGDVAIIIGAMVIAPLLGPNVALSLAAALGDLDLAKRSLKALGAGVATASLCSVLFGFIFHVDPAVPELAARTRAGLGDIALALSAGAAGALAFTSGVSAVVVGVMVAVALLPPLVAAGLLAGAGHGVGAVGAMVLVCTNVACINLAAVATFWIRKVRPRNWWEEDRAHTAIRVAVASWIILLALLVAAIVFGNVGLREVG